MACVGCSTGTNGKAAGCKSNGGCSTGGCNRMNTYDWIAVLDIEDPVSSPWVEVSFKNGTHKEFYRKENYQEVITGDWVVVETASGYDVGKITLSGDLVKLQMKKKNVIPDRVIYKVIRLASDRDLDHMRQAREMEKLALVKGRVIARSLNLDMKLGDIEYQADLRKATFFYTADKRIDFRELVRLFAKEFHVKIEMRQIGARQESARIGGIGSCGRELCCSTWLSDFKTVVTSAARYQNLAINQTKLSGQCGRLKCCLNYELDVYMESLNRFPMEIETLRSALGVANLFKTDIFRGIMFYELESGGKGKETQIFGMTPEQVREHRAKNEKGEIPKDFGKPIPVANLSGQPVEEDAGYADVTGEIELPDDRKKRNRNRGNRNKPNPSQNRPAGPSQGHPNQRRQEQHPNKPDRNPDQPPSGSNRPPARSGPPRPPAGNRPPRPSSNRPPHPDQRRRNNPPSDPDKNRFNPPPSNN